MYLGVLSDFANVLTKESISILAISTFSTDYIAVLEESTDDAVKALEKAGWQFYKETKNENPPAPDEKKLQTIA